MKRRDDATPEVPIPATHAAQQVAYAWQVAARDLRFSHPELHAQLTERVRKLLDVDVLDDPGIEIQKLQSSICIFLCDRNHEPQVCFDQFTFGLPGLLLSSDDRLQRSLDLDRTYKVFKLDLQQSLASSDDATFQLALLFRFGSFL